MGWHATHLYMPGAGLAFDACADADMTINAVLFSCHGGSSTHPTYPTHPPKPVSSALAPLPPPTSLAHQPPLRQVLGLHTDSRKVQPEDLFICLTGEKGDGHDYALEAYYAGACAIVASRPLPEVPSECPVLVVPDTLQAALDLANAFYDWPSRDLQVIGETKRGWG